MSEFKENLEYFKVPSAIIDSIRTKLAMTIFEEYANILKDSRDDTYESTPSPSPPSLQRHPFICVLFLSLFTCYNKYNSVNIFRCSRSPRNPVYVRHVDFSDLVFRTRFQTVPFFMLFIIY
jgi:hypothetical protein